MRAALGCAVALLLAAVLTACTVAPTAQRTPSAASSASPEDGPRADPHRAVAPPQASTQGDVARVRFDLGNLEIGDPPDPAAFVSPLRGTLTLPRRAARPAGLIVIGHLRAQTCADGSFQYPCRGTDSIRYDAGMDYLATALAGKGYAVLAPDLAPVFVSKLSRGGSYDQHRAWRDVVLAQAEALRSAVVDEKARSRLVGGDPEINARVRAVDASSIQWILHSRSGMMVGPTAVAAQKAGFATRGILYLATAHNTGAEPDFPLDPPPLDVPSLGIVGGADGDIPGQADQWAAASFDVDRRSPLAIAAVGSFGHNAFNAAPELDDDRLACAGQQPSPACPSAPEARAMATKTALEWAAAVDARTFPPFMTDVAHAIPRDWLGYPAQWFVHSLGARRVLVTADAHAAGAQPVRGATTAGDATAQRCRVVDPMIPVPVEDACPDTGDVAVRPGPAAILADWRPGGRVTFAGSGALRPRALVLHVAPYRTSVEGGVRLDLAYGGVVRSLGPDTTGLHDPGVNQDSAQPTTIRVPVTAGTRIDDITLGSVVSGAGGAVLVAGIEAVG